MRWVAFLVALTCSTVGCVVEDRPIVPDFDGGVDAGDCIVCPDDRPICSEDLACVECTAEDGTYCDSRGQLCDTSRFTCVDCLTNEDCDDPGESRCDLDGNECAPCQADAECDGVDGLPPTDNACDAGTCVACTADTEEETCPGGVSCDPSKRECTETPRGSLGVCEACVADSECGDEGEPSDAFRCVPLEYLGTQFPDEETGFCLKSIALGGSCTNPYRIVVTRPSLSGTASDDYCGINEELTTCPAVRALLADQECDPSNGDADCPQPAGLCRELPGVLDRCTYRCSSIVECLPEPVPGSTCGSSGSGDESYCGG